MMMEKVPRDGPGIDIFKIKDANTAKRWQMACIDAGPKLTHGADMQFQQGIFVLEEDGWLTPARMAGRVRAMARTTRKQRSLAPNGKRKTRARLKP